jgi:hypothetical protein
LFQQSVVWTLCGELTSGAGSACLASSHICFRCNKSSSTGSPREQTGQMCPHGGGFSTWTVAGWIQVSAEGRSWLLVMSFASATSAGGAYLLRQTAVAPATLTMSARQHSLLIYLGSHQQCTRTCLPALILNLWLTVEPQWVKQCFF